MSSQIWKRMWSWLGDNFGQIIGGIVVALPVGFSLRLFHQPQSFSEELIFAGTAAVLGLLTGIILSYLKDIKKISLTRPLGVYNDQTSSELPVLLFIAEQRPRKARMLEYASSTVHGIVSNLIAVDCEIQLLLQHPSYTVNDDERERICAQLKSYSMEFPDYQRLKIRCYRERASLRGRNFDGRLVHLGWFTYHIKEGEVLEEVCGHTNPLIYSVGEPKETFEPLSKWFDDVFNQYWCKADRLTKVSEDCQEISNLHIPQEWIELVSQ